MNNTPLAIILALSIFSANSFAESKSSFGRDNILIAADPAIMKLMSAVASNIDAKSLKAKPKVELHYAKKAMKNFCLGDTVEFPDLIATVREMTSEEFKRCQTHNVGSVIKLKIGYEALVIAANKNSIDLNLDERKLFRALANDVPNPKGEATKTLIENPYKTWNDIDSDAPKQAITILGPADKSRTERSVKMLGMEPGCRTWSWVADWKEVQKSYRLYRQLCWVPRKDGLYTKSEVAGTDLTKKLVANTNSIGLMGFNTWHRSKDKLKAYAINELPPTLGTISKGLYPLSRSYYVYIKVSNLKNVQGLSHFMNELLNEKTLAADGYLAKIGMVSMSAKELKREVEQASEFTAMTNPEEP